MSDVLTRPSIKRLCPRMIGGGLLVLALGSESYLMSARNAALSAQPVASISTPCSGDVAGLPKEPADATTPQPTSPLLPTADLVAADEQLTCATTAVTRRQIPLAEIKSNPFRFSASSAISANSPIPAAVASNTESQRAAALKAVERLQLQAILPTAEHRSCIINNVTCEEGQLIDGFTVEAIAKDSVTVSMGEYRFDLALTQ